jgi:hypothetical protein
MCAIGATFTVNGENRLVGLESAPPETAGFSQAPSIPFRESRDYGTGRTGWHGQTRLSMFAAKEKTRSNKFGRGTQQNDHRRTIWETRY